MLGVVWLAARRAVAGVEGGVLLLATAELNAAATIRGAASREPVMTDLCRWPMSNEWKIVILLPLVRLALAALLAASAFAGTYAFATGTTTLALPECALKIERGAPIGRQISLRLRPACPLGQNSTQVAVKTALAQASKAPEISLSFGRIAEYPWLSRLLARRAAVTSDWDPDAGRARIGHVYSTVAGMIRALPEFAALFGDWRLVRISVEEVLVKRAAEIDLPPGKRPDPDAKLPWDAQLRVQLAPR